jgi:hypothetical protein
MLDLKGKLIYTVLSSGQHGEQMIQSVFNKGAQK